MIGYELAKKLKDAGFTQLEFDVNSSDINREDFLARENGDSKEGEYDSLNDRTMLPKYFSREYLSQLKERGLLAYIPTLSELIEACGGTYHSDTTNINYTFFLKKENPYWVAGFIGPANKGPSGVTQLMIFKYHASGETPEEAVANLWLAINQK